MGCLRAKEYIYCNSSCHESPSVAIYIYIECRYKEEPNIERKEDPLLGWLIHRNKFTNTNCATD